MMRQLMISAAATVVALSATPVAAQAGSTDAGVQAYLCAFAGKCDPGAAATPAEDDAVPTMAAPATKGFRLAGPSQPTMAAPATKGFRLAGPQATTPAPATKGFRLGGQPTAAATAAPQVKSLRLGRQPAASASRAPRAGYAAARPAAVPGARADLMLGFGLNSDQMTPAAEVKARSFAKALMMPELAGKRFLIEGHTDAKGSRDLNIDLSRRRAQSVADFLVAQGVDRSRVEVKGVGPDEPLPGRSANAEANRRVEAVLIG